MFSTVKFNVFLVLFGLLWARLLLMFADPTTVGDPVGSGWPFYTYGRIPIDLIYWISSILVAPVELVYFILKPMIPNVAWFPAWHGEDMLNWYRKWVDFNDSVATTSHALADYGRNPNIIKTMAGKLDWLTVIAMFGYGWLCLFFDRLYIDFSDAYSRMTGKSPTFGNAPRYERKREVHTVAQGDNLITNMENRDELTGLYNKRHFGQKLGHEFHEAKFNGSRLSLALIEIDHFNQYSQQFGYARVQQRAKAMADIASRISPPEGILCCTEVNTFALLLPYVSNEDATRACTRMLQHFNAINDGQDPPMPGSASIGLLMVDFSDPVAQQWYSFNEVLKFTEDELRLARLNGMNRIETRSIPDANPGPLPPKSAPSFP